MLRKLNIRRPEIRCPYCHDVIGPELDKTGCESCMVWHHLECWNSHGKCCACGYTRPTARAAPGLEITAPQPRMERAPAGRCAVPGCMTQIDLISIPQLCDEHLPEDVGRVQPPSLVPWAVALILFVVCVIVAAWAMTAPPRPGW